MSNVAYPQITDGIARRMFTPADFAAQGLAVETYAGGGDLNGSAATHFRGQAGTGCDRISCPRRAGGFSGNYCGVV